MTQRPPPRLPTPRLGPALGAAALCAAIAVAGLTITPEVPSHLVSPGLPHTRTDAAGWLTTASLSDVAHLGTLPGVAWYYQTAGLSADAALNVRWAVAASAQPPDQTRFLAGEAGVTQAEVVIGLDPALLAQVQAGCPHVDAAIRRFCDRGQRRALITAIDQTIARGLGSADEAFALSALERATSLGPRGASLAADVRSGAVAVELPEQGTCRALIVRAHTLPRADAIAELRGALTDDGPLAIVAALELGRLGATEADADIAALETRLGDTGLGLTVAYARALANDDIYDGFAARASWGGL